MNDECRHGVYNGELCYDCAAEDRDALREAVEWLRPVAQLLANLPVDKSHATDGPEKDHYIMLASMGAAPKLINMMREGGVDGLVIPARDVYRARRALEKAARLVESCA